MVGNALRKMAGLQKADYLNSTQSMFHTKITKHANNCINCYQALMFVKVMSQSHAN